MAEILGEDLDTPRAVGRAPEHAHLAGDMRQVTENSASLALCALLGPTPVDEGIIRCNEFLEQTRGDQRSTALVMAYSAELHAMNGRIRVRPETDR